MERDSPYVYRASSDGTGDASASPGVTDGGGGESDATDGSTAAQRDDATVVVEGVATTRR